MQDYSYLFADQDLGDILRQREARISQSVNDLPQDQILATPKADIVEYIVSQTCLEPITLHEESGTMTQDETQVDVSYDQNRYFS